MNALEELQCKLAALQLRVTRLEQLHEPDHLRRHDVAEALVLANQLGLNRDAMGSQPRGRAIPGKQRLAGELRKRGWTCARIAKAINCSDESVKRWTKPKPCLES